MARSDYEHWNEERDIVWWNEEGKFEDASEEEIDWYQEANQDDRLEGLMEMEEENVCSDTNCT